MKFASDERSQSLIWVIIWFVASLLALWVFTTLYGGLIEPIADIASSMSAVQSEGYGGHIDLILSTLQMAGLFLGIGSILLFIVFAVWREQFRGRAPPR